MTDSSEIAKIWDRYDAGEHIDLPDLIVLRDVTEKGLLYLDSRKEKLAAYKTSLDLIEIKRIIKARLKEKKSPLNVSYETDEKVMFELRSRMVPGTIVGVNKHNSACYDVKFSGDGSMCSIYSVHWAYIRRIPTVQTTSVSA